LGSGGEGSDTRVTGYAQWGEDVETPLAKSVLGDGDGDHILYQEKWSFPQIVTDFPQLSVVEQNSQPVANAFFLVRKF
jgi:hypothetical protein